jgi:hypothetical protein
METAFAILVVEGMLVGMVVCAAAIVGVQCLRRR